MRYQTLIDQMTLADKVALCSGADFWTTRALAAYAIPPLVLADGPHGLRRQVEAADALGLNRSLPATCFPTASLSACSWDRDLLHAMGAAIGAEARQAGVAVVLGPGVNVKRNPLCGRNFEYFSEDPFLSGELAASWITGLQSQGVGASLKHFAANSQETERMASDSVVDERTLRELYLPAFETAVRKAQPATVMCAYNQLNGINCSDHSRLLRSILREEWGFEGVVLTDWGALHDRVAALEAGLDLEMPGSRGHFDAAVLAAVQQGRLAVARLDESVDRLLQLIFDLTDRPPAAAPCDLARHHELARAIAAQSAVLLKNEGALLPLRPGQTLALMGALAQEPRYQGAGSSHIQPTEVISLADGLKQVGLPYTFCPGYLLRGGTPEALFVEARTAAAEQAVAVIVAGLPAALEAEGTDRTSLELPEAQNRLIAEVAAANPNTIVVLVGGAPVEMPWLPQVKAVLNMYLAGQAGGLAAAEILAGQVNPSGKLAETYPARYADVPSAGLYETGGKQAQYREGLYVGYRYYDKVRQAVLFPFGHGLSYTTFAYSDLSVTRLPEENSATVQVTVTITNTGACAGAEVVQLYVGLESGAAYRPDQELRGFAKVSLQPGESRTVDFRLADRAFAIFAPEWDRWVVPAGTYAIQVGASSRDLRARATVTIPGDAWPASLVSVPAWYTHPEGRPSADDFEALLGRPLPPRPVWRKGGYTLDCSFSDMRGSWVVRQIMKSIEQTIARGLGGVDREDPTFRVMLSSSLHTPLRNLTLLSPASMPRALTVAIVHLANGHWLRGLLALLPRPARPAPAEDP